MALKFAANPADHREVSIGEGFAGVLGAASSGAPWACERLWRDLSPTVCGYLRLQGAPEPEDLASEVFIGVFRGLDGFRGSEAQFRSWVFTIAHRRLTDDRRRRSHNPRCGPLPALEGGGGGSDGNVEEEALRRLSADRVRALCFTLAGEQRDVLLLRLVGGFTIDEAAAVLAKTPGAVKALQRRGLAALRQVFQRQGVTL